MSNHFAKANVVRDKRALLDVSMEGSFENSFDIECLSCSQTAQEVFLYSCLRWPLLLNRNAIPQGRRAHNNHSSPRPALPNSQCCCPRLAQKDHRPHLSMAAQAQSDKPCKPVPEAPPALTQLWVGANLPSGPERGPKDQRLVKFWQMLLALFYAT
jgi:hypothetical protein